MAGTSGTGGKKRQIKARLESGIDDALYELIAPFGDRFQLSALLRLALYRQLMPDALPDDLVVFAHEFDLRAADPIEQSTMMQMVVDNQSDIAAALNKLADRPAQIAQPAPPPTLPEFAGEVQSGGIDMDAPRRRTANRPKADRGTEPVH